MRSRSARPPVLDSEGSVASLSGDPIVQEARKRFNRCAEWEATARSRFVEDIKFANGDSDNGYQWPNSTRRQRDLDDKPCLTMNVIRQHNLQIINQGKQSPLSPKIRPMGSGATTDSALTIQQLIRHVEQQSLAQQAYDTAREFQVDGGIGWWRLVTDYAEEDSFDQEIFIKEVWDPLSVYMDYNCQRADCLDSKFAFVFDTMVPREEFDEAYQDLADQIGSAAPLGATTVGDDWVNQDHIIVCEYFRKISKPDTLVSFWFQGERHTVLRSRIPPSVAKEILQDDLTITRKTAVEEVEWYLIAGEQIVDSTIWPGKYIPLIRILGRQMIIEGRLDRAGHTRYLKSAQHMYNWNAALALDTRLPTPIGWTTMEEVKIGDFLLDEKGMQTEVISTSEVFEGKCFRIEFDDGSIIVADAGHKWKVEERGKRTSVSWEWTERVLTTLELEVKRHYIWVSDPLCLESISDLPIHPYLFGAWLGDGNSSGLTLTAHRDDVEEMQENIRSLGYDIGEQKSQDAESTIRFTVYGMRQRLIHMNVFEDKHIPGSYLRASEDQRRALLQGLMDTDGHFDTSNNRCVFVNRNAELISGFIELLRTLGIKSTLQVRNKQTKIFPNGREYESKAHFAVYFTSNWNEQTFRLSRKRKVHEVPRMSHPRRTKRFGIISIEEVPSVPVKCITVSSNTHLFLAGPSMIPTHNSSQVEFGSTQGKTPWVAPAKAIEEYEQYWNTANTENHSVLPYNDIDPDSPERQLTPPQRVEPPNFAPLYEKGMETAFNQMMMTSGQWQNQMGMMGNERTGRAIQERQEQSDTSTYHFEDNFRKGLITTAVMLIDLFPKIYDTRRIIMIQADDGEDFPLQVDPTAPIALQATLDHQQRVVERIFNPRIGKYDVAPDVGPGIGTKRQQTVEALTLILTQAPALTGIIGDLLLGSMDFDKAQEAAQRLRRMVPQQALTGGPGPQEALLQQQVQALQANLAKSLDAHGKDRVKLVGKDQMRDIDIYDAETKRMQALAKMLPTDQQGLEQVIHQLVKDALDTNLLPILEQNLKAQQEGQQGSVGAPAEEPPMEGAAKAPDGEWYIRDPTRMRGFLRLEPLAQLRPPGSTR